jgi:hypothetical protein
MPESSASAAVFATVLVPFCTAAGAWTRLASARTLIAEGLASVAPFLTLSLVAGDCTCSRTSPPPETVLCALTLGSKLHLETLFLCIWLQSAHGQGCGVLGLVLIEVLLVRPLVRKLQHKLALLIVLPQGESAPSTAQHSTGACTQHRQSGDCAHTPSAKLRPAGCCKHTVTGPRGGGCSMLAAQLPSRPCDTLTECCCRSQRRAAESPRGPNGPVAGCAAAAAAAANQGSVATLC